MNPTPRTYLGQSYKIFTEYNEKNVFVEDINKETLYEELLYKADLPYKITKIFCLGSKAGVLEHSKNDNDNDNVYIIDGDWDKLKSIQYSDKRVVSLSKYSIENYLLIIHAFVGVMKAEAPTTHIEEKKAKKYFKDFFKECSSDLLSLCEAFYIAQSIKTGAPKNSQFNPGRFQKEPSCGEPCPVKISKYISEIKKVSHIQSEWDDAKRLINSYPILDVVPGKYLLFYIWEYLRRKFGVKGLDQERLKVRLAQLLIQEDLEALKKDLEAIPK